MTHSLNQPSAKPTKKVTAAGLGALAATVILTLCDGLEAFDLPTIWDTLITGVVAFTSAYATRSSRSDV